LKSFHLAPPKLHISWITTEEKENGRNYGTRANCFFFMRNKLIKRDIPKHIGYIPNTYRLPDWKVAMSNEQFRSFLDHGKPSPLSGELLKNSSFP